MANFHGHYDMPSVWGPIITYVTIIHNSTTLIIGSNSVILNGNIKDAANGLLNYVLGRYSKSDCRIYSFRFTWTENTITINWAPSEIAFNVKPEYFDSLKYEFDRLGKLLTFL
ncbi:hypothetical protein UFOVP1290_82 [uncultured Caudovirales phage]|uniref:Uncharacterized protein n=1 Tax=uncultured Caudovirales phage TaxID=2100421 RepID=A0A6J5RKH5_9CAUD|nr:hypothetical protein UFOVP1290_82 [uncultured Caudovirales phage]